MSARGKTTDSEGKSTSSIVEIGTRISCKVQPQPERPDPWRALARSMTISTTLPMTGVTYSDVALAE